MENYDAHAAVIPPVENNTYNAVGIPPVENKNNTHVAAVLSFFVPGLGQLYKGKLLKFFIFYFVWSFLIFMTLGVGARGADAGLFIFLISGVAWIISLVDVYEFSD